MLTIHNIEEKLKGFGLQDRHKIHKIETTDDEYRFHIRTNMVTWSKGFFIVLERKSNTKKDGERLYKFYKTSGLTQPTYATGKYISTIEGMQHVLDYVERDDRTNLSI